MSEPIMATIALVQQQISEIEVSLCNKKRMVNELCKLAEQPPLYNDIKVDGPIASIRSDEFYGQPLATVVRMILEKRHAASLGAAAVSEIYDAMIQGGYDFKGKNDDNNKRGLYISLGKNSATFHKLPNGKYGLLDWYPAAKETKSSNGKDDRKEKPLHQEVAEDEFEREFGESVVVKPK